MTPLLHTTPPERTDHHMPSPIETKTIAGKTFYYVDGEMFQSLAAARAAAGVRVGIYDGGPGANLGGKRIGGVGSLRRGASRAALGDLRSVVSPVKTSIGVATLTAAAAGTVTQTTQVDQTLPAGCILYLSGSAAGLAACDGVTSVLVDGQNIFLNSQTVPTDAVNPTTQNAVGILIPRIITKSVTVAASFNAAGTVRAWFSAPSLEIEQALDACDCD